MKNIGTLVLLLALITSTLHAQSTDWGKLAQVSFKTEFDENWGMEVKKPIFSNVVMQLSGKEVLLDGYIYPLEGKKSSAYFVLSSLPLASCFFCGKGGPETVVEVSAKKVVPFTEKKIKVKGKLGIKDSDPSGLIYTLQEASLVE
ncbi:MAG: hypothetical protein OHK0038_22890 [Flammeovirgaceae bacterium]